MLEKDQQTNKETNSGFTLKTSGQQNVLNPNHKLLIIFILNELKYQKNGFNAE